VTPQIDSEEKRRKIIVPLPRGFERGGAKKKGRGSNRRRAHDREKKIRQVTGGEGGVISSNA